MKSFIAENRGQFFAGGWRHCMEWGKDQVKEDLSTVIKIYAIRGGEKGGRIVTEISKEGVYLIQNGRYTPLRKLHGATRG